MKRRRILLILLVLYFGAACSQITTGSTKRIIATTSLMVDKIRLFLSAKATTIRKDAVMWNLQLRQFRDSGTILKANIDNAADQSKNKLNSLSETEETKSLRFQMSIKRMSTLSNLLKINQRNIIVNYSEFKMNPGL